MHLNNNKSVADVNECNAGTASCNENAECANTDGSYTCACPAGYAGDGALCVGRDVSLLS